VANGDRNWSSYAGDGLAAGLAVLLAQMTVASVTNLPTLYPLAAAASSVMGRHALIESNGRTYLVGLATYFIVSLGLGLLFHASKAAAAMSSLLTTRGRLRPAVSGALYGLAFFLVLLSVRSVFCPWLEDTPLVFSWWMLSGFFGVPLGLFAASTERRQPVELKIIYAGTADPPKGTKSVVPKQGRKPDRPLGPPRPHAKGTRRPPSSKKGRLRLLSNSEPREGDDHRR
jgi:hypothetical protein